MEEETMRTILYVIVAFFVIAAILAVFYMYADKLFSVTVG